MKPIRFDAIRRLIPAGAVLAVLVFSFVTQTPSLASSTNNCGVKGYGYHDHGKVCPNRPFPGHGNGVERILGSSSATNRGAVNPSSIKSDRETQVTTTSTIKAPAVDGTSTTASGDTKKGHVHANRDHVRGNNGHGRGQME